MDSKTEKPRRLSLGRRFLIALLERPDHVTTNDADPDEDTMLSPDIYWTDSAGDTRFGQPFDPSSPRV